MVAAATVWGPAEVGALDETEPTVVGDQVALVRGADGRLAVTTVGTAADSSLVAAPSSEFPVVEVLAVAPDATVEGTQVVVPEADPLRRVQGHLDLIDAEALWPIGTGAGTTIAVLDSGVRATHTDLLGRVLPGSCYLGGGATGCALPDQGPGPFHPHGTHVAGLAAAGAGNGIGGVGVAPDAQILPVRVLDQNNDGFLSDLVAGVVWALQVDLDGDGQTPDIDVINLSVQIESSNAVLATAIAEAISQGVPVVAAAGNLGAVHNPTVFPAAEPGVIGVGSVEVIDGELSRAPSSSFGPWVDVVAPGVDTWSTGNANDIAVGLRSGTSMATPQVSAAVAVIRSVRPSWTPDDIAELLATSTRDLGEPGPDFEYGAGALDLSLVTASLLAAEPAEALVVNGARDETTIALDWSGGPPSVTGWEVEVDGAPVALLPAEAGAHVVEVSDQAARRVRVVPLIHYVQLDGVFVRGDGFVAPPGPPTELVIEPGPHRLDVSWAPPDDDGGSPVVDYVLRVFDGDAQVAERVTDTETATVRDLGSSGAYRVEVSARTAVAEGASATGTAQALDLDRPSEPQVDAVVVAGQPIVLDWEPVAGPAEYYDIITPHRTLARLPAAVTRWEGPPPERRPARLIAVVAVNDLGSSRSDWQRVVDLPAAVGPLVTSAQGLDVVVSWAVPEAGPEPIGFVVEWGVPGSELVDRTTVSGTSLRLRPTEADQPLRISVRAQVEGALGHASVVELPPLVDTLVPVTDLVATVGETGVELRWTPGEGSVGLVLLERRIEDGPWVPLAIHTPNTTATRDATAPAGADITYRLRSVGLAGEVLSNEATVTVASL